MIVTGLKNKTKHWTEHFTPCTRIMICAEQSFFSMMGQQEEEQLTNSGQVGGHYNPHKEQGRQKTHQQTALCWLWGFVNTWQCQLHSWLVVKSHRALVYISLYYLDLLPPIYICKTRNEDNKQIDTQEMSLLAPTPQNYSLGQQMTIISTATIKISHCFGL